MELQSSRSTILYFLKPALDAIVAGVTWLWENVLRPFGMFLMHVFYNQIKFIIDIVNALRAAWEFLCNIGKSVVDAVSNIGNSLRNLCFKHATPMVNKFNQSLAESVGLTSSLQGNLGDLRGGLITVSRGPSATSPSLREVSITQYNVIQSELDMRRAGEAAYRAFIKKIGNL